MKNKTTVKESQRDLRLTVRMTAGDKERLQRLRALFSPLAPLSEGRTISGALELAEKHVKK